MVLVAPLHDVVDDSSLLWLAVVHYNPREQLSWDDFDAFYS